MPLADILSCPEDQLLDAITCEEPYSIGVWCFAKRIGELELIQLGRVLGIGVSKFDLVGDPLPEGPWPQAFPDGFTNRVRQLADDETESVVAEWSAAEEFQHAGGPTGELAESLERYLKELRDFLKANEGPFFLVNRL